MDPRSSTSRSTPRLLNILTVIIGLLSGATGVGGAVISFGILWALLRKIPSYPTDFSGLFVLGIWAGITFLGFLIASRALLHLRHPDAGTVRDMIGTAIYLIVFLGVAPLVKSAWVFPLIIGLYCFHRYLVKRIAAREFPAGDTPPISSDRPAQP